MKINAIQITKTIKSAMVALPLLVSAPLVSSMNNYQKTDTFEKSVKDNDKAEMSPEVRVAGENVYPAVVIDKSDNKLYFYDLDTSLDTVYTVNLANTKALASKLMVITSIDNNEDKAGTQVINLGAVDTKTGEISDYNSAFIKGNKTYKNKAQNEVQMKDNDVKNLANWLFEGQYVLIK